MLNDATIDAAQRGDESAFACLYDAHAGRVFALCLRLSGDRTQAEELVQDVFVPVWERLASFRGDSSFTTWLHRVAVNTVFQKASCIAAHLGAVGEAAGRDLGPRLRSGHGEPGLHGTLLRRRRRAQRETRHPELRHAGHEAGTRRPGRDPAAQDADGVLSVETIDGVVTLARISGAVRARSGGGRLSLAQIHGTLTAATVSGVIELTGTALADARLETIGGGITVRGTVARGALLDLETHNGPITLFLTRGALPALALSSRAGTVTNPLGAGNIAAGRIDVRTFRGDINVVAASGIEERKTSTPP